MNQEYEDLLYQSGLTASGCWDELGTYEQEAIEKFAELCMALEREECAKMCDEVGKESASQWPNRFANMIRARGKA